LGSPKLDLKARKPTRKIWQQYHLKQKPRGTSRRLSMHHEIPSKAFIYSKECMQILAARNYKTK
jgi:hypothetical protein